MLIGYARVSTGEQKLDLQLDALKAAGCERCFYDVSRGAKSQRAGLDTALGFVREGDVLVVVEACPARPVASTLARDRYRIGKVWDRLP